jgi:hypothetical protein
MGGESLPLASFGILSGPRSLSLPKGRYPFERALNRRARNAPAKKAAAKMQQL